MEVRSFLRGQSDENGCKYIDFNNIVPSPDGGKFSDWNYANWGTKWNAYSQKSPYFNTIEFITTNYAVPDLIRTISEKFPDIAFIYHFDLSDVLLDPEVTLFIKNGIETEIPQECFPRSNNEVINIVDNLPF